MNTSTIAHIISGQSFRRSIVAVGALLIAGAVALGLVRSATISTAPSAVPAVRVHTLILAGGARYEDFKLRQADQVAAAAPRAVVTTAAQMRYAEFKRQQVERVEAKLGGTAAVASAAHEGFDDFKRRQIEQIEAGMR